MILRSHDSFGNEVTLTDERRVSEKRGGTLMDGEGKKVGRKKWILGFALTALVLAGAAGIIWGAKEVKAHSSEIKEA